MRREPTSSAQFFVSLLEGSASTGLTGWEGTEPVSVLPGMGGSSLSHEPPSVSRGSALPPSRLFPSLWSGKAGGVMSDPYPVKGKACLGFLHPHLTPLPDPPPEP